MSQSLRPCHQQRLTHDLEIDTDQGREEASNFLACYPTMVISHLKIHACSSFLEDEYAFSKGRARA